MPLDGCAIEGAGVTAVSDGTGAASFAAFAGRFVTGRFAADFFVTARFGVLFFVAAFFEVFVVGCFLAVRLTVFFFAAFLAFFGARAVVFAFAPGFFDFPVFLAPVVFLPRFFAAATRRCLRGLTRDFFVVFFLAEATTNSL
ncbi:hypothetical protein [Nitrobacter sp.]|uniref:hypothetical protein n=1 Tax=Nitrobacter sp. TaxID=29420 RepID=UPI003F65256D